MHQSYLDFAASRTRPDTASRHESGKADRAALRTIVAGAIMFTLLAAGILLRLVAYLPASAHFSG